MMWDKVVGAATRRDQGPLAERDVLPADLGRQAAAAMQERDALVARLADRDAAVLTAERARDDLAAQLAARQAADARFAAELRTLSENFRQLMEPPPQEPRETPPATGDGEDGSPRLVEKRQHRRGLWHGR